MDQTPSMTRKPVATIRPRRFNVAEYRRMTELGILRPEERTELIEGEIIEMPAVGGPHIRAVSRLIHLFAPLVGGRAKLSVQSPVRLDDGNEPEPDVALLRPPRDEYDEETPVPAEVLLLIEVADTSRAYDRNTKRPLYARNGIPELWILDLDARVVEVCRNPSAGGYASVETARPGQVIGIETLPGIEVPVERAVGRPRA